MQLTDVYELFGLRTEYDEYAERSKVEQVPRLDFDAWLAPKLHMARKEIDELHAALSDLVAHAEMIDMFQIPPADVALIGAKDVLRTTGPGARPQTETIE